MSPRKRGRRHRIEVHGKGRGGEEGGRERGTRGPEAGINDGTALVRLVTAALRHPARAVPPPSSSPLPPPPTTRSRNAARILFVSTCLRARHPAQALPTNKQSAFSSGFRHCRPASQPRPSLPPLPPAMRRFFYRIVNTTMEEGEGGRGRRGGSRIQGGTSFQPWISF